MTGGTSGKAGPFLNSPFFIAIETGVLIGGITQLYNMVKARSDRKLAEDNARREKQITVLSAVASDLPIYISTMGSMRKLRGWLEAHPQENDEHDELGRSREEVLKEYTEFFKLYLKTKGETAILAEIVSFYETQTVCDLVIKEDQAIHTIRSDAKDKAKLQEALKAEEDIFASLLNAMAEEIRPTPDNRSAAHRKGRCPLPRS
jgi:hypothetical protein